MICQIVQLVEKMQLLLSCASIVAAAQAKCKKGSSIDGDVVAVFV